MMEMEEADIGELEYHVTFPPALSSDGGVGDRPFSPSSQQREAVVILLGWAGCLEKHLTKYSSIYQSQGLTTIRYTAPRKILFFEPNSLKETAYKLLELQYDLGLEDNPILVHAFSNGGGMVYRFMTELLHDKDNPQFADLKLAGCIFDSCPGDTSVFTGMRVLYYNETIPLFARLMGMLFFFLACCFAFILPAKWIKIGSIFTYLESMKNDPATCPRLFLYSKVDKLCDFHLVEDTIAKTRERGIEVRQVCFEDSKHVSHFLKYQREYLNHCVGFVNFCLERHQQLNADREDILADS